MHCIGYNNMKWGQKIFQIIKCNLFLAHLKTHPNKLFRFYKYKYSQNFINMIFLQYTICVHYVFTYLCLDV